MNDTLKAFMEQARQDPALAARVQALAALPPTEAAAALAALAAEQGFIPQELDEDELDAVAGGVDATSQSMDADASRQPWLGEVGPDGTVPIDGFQPPNTTLLIR